MSHPQSDPAARALAQDPLNVLVVQTEDPAQSTLWQSAALRYRACLTWQRDLVGARQAMAKVNFDLVVTDSSLADGEGTALIAARFDPHQCWATVVLTEYGDVFAAVSAMKRGAVDVIQKPTAEHRLNDVLESVFMTRQRAGDCEPATTGCAKQNNVSGKAIPRHARSH